MKKLYLIFLLFPLTVNGQAILYNFSHSTATFSYLNNATIIPSLAADDALSEAITFPGDFSFPFFGVERRQFKVSTNGFLTFNTNEIDYYSNNDQALLKQAIMPLWDNLSMSSGRVSYWLSGTAPNRIFTLEWKNARWTSLAALPVISFQVRLFENGKIEFAYRREHGSVIGPLAFVGLKGESRAHAYCLSSVSAPALAEGVYNSISELPVTGQIFTFLPATPTYSAPTIQATHVNLSASGRYTATITWTNGNGHSRVVFIKEAPYSEFENPTVVDGQAYQPGSYENGSSQLGHTGWYCVYDGSGNEAVVEGLTFHYRYMIKVVECNGMKGACLYQNATGNQNPVSRQIRNITRPSTPASVLSVVQQTQNSIKVNIAGGAGDYHTVFVKEGEGGSATPADATYYSPNRNFGNAVSQLGTTGWYCVALFTYSGDVLVSALKANTTYTFQVVDFNGDPGEETYNSSIPPVAVKTYYDYPQNYTFAAEQSSFGYLTGGNRVTAIEKVNKKFKVPLGFIFHYGGVHFTEAYAYSNGVLMFNTNIGVPVNNNSFNFTNLSPLLAPLWGYLDMTGGAASYTTTGAAPNRIFTFEWKNVRWSIGADAAGISFQTKLYENGVIEFIYQQEPGVLVNASASIGMLLPNQRYYSLSAASSSPTVSSTENSFITTKPASGQLYRFSPDKNDQTITLDPFPSKVYGDDNFNITGSASSGLPVSFAGDNQSVVAVSSHGVVTIVAAGRVNITASQSGDIANNPAPNMVRILNIGRASQTITFSPLPVKSMGDRPFSGGAGSSAYLPVSYISDDPSIAVIENALIKIVGVGTVNITAQQNGNGNYAQAEGVTQALSVAQGSQTVTFRPLPEKYYGDPSFVLTATASSGLAVTYEGDNNSVATVSPSGVVTLTATGEVYITASQSGNENYLEAVPVSQLLIVRKGKQSISFSPIPNRGQTDPGFSLDATASSGLPVSYVGDNNAVATVSPSGWVSVVADGTMRIIASQPGNDLYSEAPRQMRRFTVGVGAQSISFTDLPAKSYGEEDFTLGAVASSGLPVNYAGDNDNVATVSNSGLVHITGVGSVKITASQSGNSSYHPAARVEKTLTVTRGNQVISFDPLTSRSLSEGAFDLTAGSSSGLSLSYTASDPLVASVQGNSVTLHSLGTTTITASQSGDNLYLAAADVARTLTVNNLASQTITFNSLAPVTFGTSSTTATAVSSSGLPVSFSGDNSAVAYVNPSGLISITGAGRVRIKASQGGNTTFNPAPGKVQELLVNKADQDIIFPEIPTHYITDAPFMLLAATGSNLPVTYTFSDPTVAKAVGHVVTILSIGVTTITAVQKGDSNYNPSPELTQTLTISKLSQTIDFPPIPRKSTTGSPFTVIATATSGLPVSFISSDRSIATVSGSLITILDEGQTNIIANQLGDTHYQAAPQVLQSLMVTGSGRLPQYITFPAIGEKHLGGNRIFLTATATSRLPITYTCNHKVSISEDGIVTLLRTGMADIIAAQSGNNLYNPAANVERTFCINPAPPVISESNGMLTSSVATGNQWYKDGLPIPAATATTYPARGNGSYTAKVIIETCASASSNALIVSTTGDIPNNEYLIFPNPVHDLLTIKWNQAATVNILTITGQILYTSSFTGKIDLDMSGYPTGIYLVKIMGEETVVKKVVKY